MKVKQLVESKAFEAFITVCILLNAVTLGLETSKEVMQAFGAELRVIDRIFLTIFVSELVLRMITYRSRFFSDPWRIFDFIVVGIALFPSQGAFSVLRALRVLRTLRLITVVPALKRVVAGLLSAIPGLGAVTVIMGLIFYVGAVMATKLFAADFPDFFGTLGHSAYTLFQIMTLESWSMGVVRPVMEMYPLAWMFFVPFILITTFTMLNLFIAVIVNSMQAESEEAAAVRAQEGHEERLMLLQEVRALRGELAEMKKR